MHVLFCAVYRLITPDFAAVRTVPVVTVAVRCVFVVLSVFFFFFVVVRCAAFAVFVPISVPAVCVGLLVSVAVLVRAAAVHRRLRRERSARAVSEA